MKTAKGIAFYLIYLILATAYSYISFTGTALLVFSLAVLVIWLLGLYFMYAGREEFGDQHRKLATIGCWLVPITIILSIFVGFRFAVSREMAGSLLSPIVLILALSSVVLLVFSLVNKAGKILLIFGAAATICAIIIVRVGVQTGILFGTRYYAIAPWLRTLLPILPLIEMVPFILAYLIALVNAISKSPPSWIESESGREVPAIG
jgi:hypothetical protein